ncbi:peroxiredoxin [Mesobacillus zeae]|uniref:Peroxiredoxin n=1 Tax=Mesobacillus zeae TaxID=1917180 RepID=A0A398BBC1_9BACI|nr:peroxiredoxin [Mesobacillus zeae]
MAAVAAVYPHIQAAGAELLAISTDSIYAHNAFKQTSPPLKDAAFPLVSDRNQEIGNAYKVLDRKAGATVRASVFISPDQIIHAKFIYPREIGRNIPEHFRLLQAFFFEKETGKGVPANWIPGHPGINMAPSYIDKV